MLKKYIIASPIISEFTGKDTPNRGISGYALVLCCEDLLSAQAYIENLFKVAIAHSAIAANPRLQEIIIEFTQEKDKSYIPYKLYLVRSICTGSKISAITGRMENEEMRIWADYPISLEDYAMQEITAAVNDKNNTSPNKPFYLNMKEYQQTFFSRMDRTKFFKDFNELDREAHYSP